MIFPLFMFLLGISLIFVVLGFWRTEHSELSIIGFLFIFLLSFTIFNNNLEVKSGELTTTALTYDNSSLLVSEDAVTSYSYEEYGSHNIGLWMIIGSLFGFIIVIISLKKTKWGKEE